MLFGLPPSAYEAETSEAEVKDKERVYGDAHPVLDDTAAAQNTGPGSKRPADKHKVDGYPGDPVKAECRHESSDD